MSDRSRRSSTGRYECSGPDRLGVTAGVAAGLMLAPSNPTAAGAALCAGAAAPHLLRGYQAARPVAKGTARAYRWVTLSADHQDKDR